MYAVDLILLCIRCISDGTFDLYGCHGTSVCIPLLPSPSLVSYWCRYQYILPIMYCGLHAVHGLQSGRHDAMINQHSREKHCAILFNRRNLSGSGFVYLCRSIDSSINQLILIDESINKLQSNLSSVVLSLMLFSTRTSFVWRYIP